jgi:hypothetical protein
MEVERPRRRTLQKQRMGRKRGDDDERFDEA